MIEYKYEKPWQIFPTQLILHAFEHAEKKTDFDKLVAYLTLDVGVEMALKTFLKNRHYPAWKHLKKQAQKEGRELRFCDIVEAVGTASNDIQGADVKDANHFHNLRNELYHEGGFPPSEEDLKRYLELAQELLKILIGVDVADIELLNESEYVVQGKNGNRTIDDISSELLRRLEYFHESCAILTEQLHPKYATRKFAVKLQSIWENLGDGVSKDLYDDRRSLDRLRLFNKLSGMHTEDQGLVDFLIEDANHLYVRIALQDFSENFDADWDEYKNIAAKLKRLPETWKQAIDDSRLDSQKIYEEYKEIKSWISFNQEKLDQRIYEIFPDNNREMPAMVYSLFSF